MTNPHEHLPNQTRPEETQGESLLPSQLETKETSQTNEEKFLELLSPLTEKIGELSAQLHEVTEQALATTVNPHYRKALMITANIISWRLFGEVGDPLPFGLVQGRDEDGALSILYDTRTSFGNRCAAAAVRKLDTAGLDEIYESLDTLMGERSAQIKEVFSNTIEASQAFQFINALVNGELPQRPEEQPLTPFWRAIRETQVNQSVRTRWGLEAQEQIIPHTEPDYDLRRELSRLDDETSLALAKPENDPLARLRSYLGPLVQTEFTKAHPDDVLAGFARDSDGDAIIRTVQYPEGYSVRSDWIQAAAHKLALQINESGSHVQVIAEEWLYYLTESILWPKEEPQELKQLGKKAVDEAWDYLENKIQQGRRFSSGDYESTTSPQGVLHAGLANPSGAYINLSRLDKDKSDDHKHYSSSQSYAEINTPPDEHVGEVLRFSTNARGQHACRLVQSEPKEGLPPLNGDEELVIRLFGKEFKHAQPCIPGYSLTSNTGEMYGFVPDEMGDPYASADILLTPEQRYTLAARYSEIGLQKLARVIERKSRLTVQDLTSLISEENTYITSSEAQKLKPRLSTSVYLYELEDFRVVVRDGNLHVQCTGAAQFLRFSLEEVFGKGAAATADGYMLSRRTISTTAEHSQTVFTYQGQTYLLDATPSSTEVTAYDDYLFDGIRMHFRRPSFPLAASRIMQIDPDTPRMVEKAPDQSESREQKIQAIRHSLDMQLMGLMQASDRDAVYARVNTLPIGDPFRTTVETTLRATYGEATRDEAERLHQYLAAYQEAGEVLRRQMKVPSYDAQVVQVLQSTAEQLLNQF